MPPTAQTLRGSTARHLPAHPLRAASPLRSAEELQSWRLGHEWVHTGLECHAFGKPLAPRGLDAPNLGGRGRERARHEARPRSQMGRRKLGLRGCSATDGGLTTAPELTILSHG